MHESSHITRTGNGSQTDHKGNNYAIQTHELSQHLERSAGKSNRIHFLESNFPQDSLYLDISFFVNLRTMISKNISETFISVLDVISREVIARTRSGKNN